MPPFLTSMLSRVTATFIGYIAALFFIGGADRIAREYNVIPAQKALSVIDAAVVQERTLVLAPGTPLEVSGTFVFDNKAVPVSATVSN